MEESSDVLEHQTRKMLFNFILSNPGTSFGTLEKTFALNHSTLRYHLDHLKKKGEIWSVVENGRLCFFPKKVSSDNVKVHGLDLNTLTIPQRRVLRCIRDHPGITQKEILRSTRINPNTLTYTLARLQERNLIWKIKKGGIIGYEYKSKESIIDEMTKMLIRKFLSDEIDQETFLSLRAELEKKR
jgi:predicted transcriptional regulator